jgi:hypothetical protein
MHEPAIVLNHVSLYTHISLYIAELVQLYNYHYFLLTRSLHMGVTIQNLFVYPARVQLYYEDFLNLYGSGR